jgi:hypothetical protein
MQVASMLARVGFSSVRARACSVGTPHAAVPVRVVGRACKQPTWRAGAADGATHLFCFSVLR